MAARFVGQEAMNKLSLADRTCLYKCKGKCIAKDNVQQQRNFRKEFPDLVMPNDCVASCTGQNMCPFA